MSEYIYRSNGEPLANERGEILLARAGEIVRCRDCKGSRIFNGKRYPGKEYEGRMYCIFWSGEWVKPDGYCFKAKRRNDV